MMNKLSHAVSSVLSCASYCRHPPSYNSPGKTNCTSMAWLRSRLTEVMVQPSMPQGTMPSKKLRSGFTFKANVLPSAVVPLIRTIDPGRWAVQAHAGSGIVWGIGRQGAPIDALAADVLRLREMAIAGGGNLVLPRCPTDRKDRAHRTLVPAPPRARDDGGRHDPGTGRRLCGKPHSVAKGPAARAPGGGKPAARRIGTRRRSI